MDPILIASILRGVGAGLNWIMAMRGGDHETALGIVNDYLARPGSRLDPEIFDVVKMAAAGLQALSARGISINEAQDLLRNAAAESRDLTDDEVDTFLATTQVVADDVEAKLQALEAEEAAEVDDENDDPNGGGNDVGQSGLA